MKTYRLTDEELESLLDAYFMAEANPITAADKPRMMELQAAVCGAVISRHVSQQDINPLRY
jgi:hypothetical protein